MFSAQRIIDRGRNLVAVMWSYKACANCINTKKVYIYIKLISIIIFIYQYGIEEVTVTVEFFKYFCLFLR